ncbi:MAG TPA: hypothetical protein VNG69_06425 [Casimicrobiaceae bacterium]|nr:hypothetical protein [Casimicrobiaceae bacterium]
MDISETPKPKPIPDLCIHIFYVSSAMVGVCLTVIGLVQVVVSIKTLETIADDLLAADALLFLAASVVSYWALRTRDASRVAVLERVADVMFLSAIAGMVAISAFMTYAMTGL